MIQSSITTIPLLGSGFYDLRVDPNEENNLLLSGMTAEEEQKFNELTRAINRLLGS